MHLSSCNISELSQSNLEKIKHNISCSPGKRLGIALQSKKTKVPLYIWCVRLSLLSLWVDVLSNAWAPMVEVTRLIDWWLIDRLVFPMTNFLTTRSCSCLSYPLTIQKIWPLKTAFPISGDAQFIVLYNNQQLSTPVFTPPLDLLPLPNFSMYIQNHPLRLPTL